MTVIGLLVGTVDTDINSGVQRFTFGFLELTDKVELVARWHSACSASPSSCAVSTE